MPLQIRRTIASVAAVGVIAVLLLSNLRHSAPVCFWIIVAASGTQLIIELLEWIGRHARGRQGSHSWIDPGLVDLALKEDSPELQARQKEVSVVFADVVGLVPVSPALKDNAGFHTNFMGLLVPIVRRHGGYLKPLLAEHMMYFFNAPQDNPNHARDAVASAMEMQAAIAGVSRPLLDRDRPTIRLQCGISTGFAIVGNVGPPDRSFVDYTALGDSVNLASRLESANRYFDTGILLNDRARELAGDAFLYRPIGIIEVLGTRGVMITEALALMAKATDEQKRLAEMTSDMVTAFIRADFQQALTRARAIADAFGDSRLTTLYAAECQRHLKTPPEHFTGELSLDND